MKKIKLTGLVFVPLLLAVGLNRWEVFQIHYPDTWPQPVYDFNSKPLDDHKIQLGRKLFYDPVLSQNNSISCASCHLSYTAFTHTDHALSHGISDSIGTRNSPVLINLAWNRFFMWDGAINHIEVQALAPISHPAEMGETIGHVVEKLQRSTEYPLLFRQAFNEDIITGRQVLIALAQFQLTLVSCNSKYDRVMAGKESFDEMEQKGYTLFLARCNTCHREPLFTNGDFENNGLPVDTTLNDYGRYRVTLIPEDSLRFKVPTLRNIEYSYPYMHDGRFTSLSEVMNHYSSGIQPNKTLSPQLKNTTPLTGNEKVELIAFLKTLSDREFIFNPGYAYPR